LPLFQNCHLERRERARSRVCSRSRKTCGLPVRRTCRRVIAAGRPQKAGPSTPQDRPRADDLAALGMTEEGWKNVGCGVRRSHPSAKNALGWGTPRFCGACKVYGSFVGSPWLCQGLRCLRMTAFRGRMRPFDNSCEDEAVRLKVSSFQSCHLERRERARSRVCSRSGKPAICPRDGLAAG